MKTLIETIHLQFSDLHSRTIVLTNEIPVEMLFCKPEFMKGNFRAHSCGELLLRTTATVEQTFGGITTRLWDDPFEWTLPEEISTNQKIIEYLFEVEATRKRGFSLFKTDEDLYKEIPAPEEFKSIAKILIETIARAERFFGNAQTMYQFLIVKNSPPVLKT